MQVFYLHGFMSSSRSTKADFFAERLRGHGIDLRAPDFNQPNFTTLTMTRMLDQLEHQLVESGEPSTLIGSSLGGTLAVLAASRLGSKIDRLVLLAPAVMFGAPEHHLLPADRIDQWRRRGTEPFFHHAYHEERLLSYAFYEDTLQYDTFGAPFSQATLIFQGRRDTSVDPRTVEAFARSRPNVTLSLLDDDHQMHSSLPRIWMGIEDFLGLAA